MLEHRFRTQEARRQAERGDVGLGQLHGHAVGEARQGCFDQVVEDVPAITREMAVDHLDDQAAIGLDH